MLIKVSVKYVNKKIILQTNDIKLYDDFKNEYSNYFYFANDEDNATIKLKVLNDKQLYEKYFKQLKDNRINIKNIYIRIRRENILIIDKIKNEISLIYSEYTDEKLQHVEEIICGIFGKLFEYDGFSFIHAACVSKDRKGILILGDRNNGKTSLMLQLLQNGFDFVSNSQTGINGTMGVGIPTRIGIRTISLENGIIEQKYRKQIECTNGYINYEKEKGNKQEDIEKFNVTIEELNDIFNVKSNSIACIKTIIDIHYLQGIENTKIRKMDSREIAESFYRNIRNGIYQPVDYLENLFEAKQNKNLHSLINVNDFEGYKIIQNQMNSCEIINFINNQLR